MSFCLHAGVLHCNVPWGHPAFLWNTNKLHTCWSHSHVTRVMTINGVSSCVHGNKPPPDCYNLCHITICLVFSELPRALNHSCVFYENLRLAGWLGGKLFCPDGFIVLVSERKHMPHMLLSRNQFKQPFTLLVCLWVYVLLQPCFRSEVQFGLMHIYLFLFINIFSLTCKRKVKTEPKHNYGPWLSIERNYVCFDEIDVIYSSRRRTKQ